MNILGEAPRYRAYLLRCWAEHGPSAPAPAVWRYILEDPHTGERRGFADLAALLAFLAAELAGQPTAPAGAPNVA